VHQYKTEVQVYDYVDVVKAVIASAVDPQTGDPLYPRTWNHSFIDAPTISGQKQPCATTEVVNRAITNATSHQEQLLYAMLSGAGLRIAEALSVHVGGTKNQTSCDAPTATITIRSSIYNGAEQHRVKTQAANRVVDLDPRLNAAIIKFVAEQNIQPGAFLFQSTSGRAMHLRTATARLKKRGVPGFHSLRGRQWQHADLSGLSLFGAQCDGINLLGARLQRTDFQKASLRGAELAFSYAAGANFRGADLRECSLYRAEIGLSRRHSSADFTDALVNEASDIPETKVFGERRL
jgi:uncharacterized protein YjbI with pentapeptide repeats